MASLSGQTYQEELFSMVEEPNYYNQQGEISAFFSGKKIFITGGLGFIGRLIMEKLLSNLICDIIPADYVINNIIAAAWDVAQKRSISQSVNLCSKDNKYLPDYDEIPVYNSVSSVQRPITWGIVENYLRKSGLDVPWKKTLWYYSLWLNKYYYFHIFLAFFLHWIPAIIVDTLLYLSGRKPILLNIYRKINKFKSVISSFTTNEWEFTNDNVLKLWDKLSVVDKSNFFFNVADIDWQCFSITYMRGVRVFLVKEPMDTVEESRPFYRRLKIAHYTLKWSIYVLILWILYSLLFASNPQMKFLSHPKKLMLTLSLPISGHELVSEPKNQIHTTLLILVLIQDHGDRPKSHP
ncbi:PREDICTED: putative fatty acyl-CoA reductase CG5065 [Polistes dominula]|uniref:Fatty acyl-CoA reductase CG5065 n=1 Tax=Polistes dominula TaxID=743375 RepID=A0ABM1J2F1_POLDO|nr:PREDICTED: putative fatty acyl-CoA reductase CG5065 [Polistes dominula]